MKRLALLTLAAFLLSVLGGCHRGESEFTIKTIADSRHTLITTDAGWWPEFDTLGVENKYSLAWPAEGVLSEEVEHELLLRCFGDSNATSFEQAADAWLSNSWLYEDDVPNLRKKVVDSIPGSIMFNYANLESEYTAYDNIGTFHILTQVGSPLAAHGVYYANYVNIDLNTRQIIHLNDLVDTSLLGEVIVRAVEDLAVNKEALDCLFDDYQQTGKLPVPENFLIDSTRSTIILVYQIYEVAPYACGIQSIVLPIFWLSKHIPLTPYAKELFGEDSSL